MTEKSSKTMEIRWHGRGGQGAKTACLLLAEAAFFSGKYVRISGVRTGAHGRAHHGLQSDFR